MLAVIRCFVPDSRLQSQQRKPRKTAGTYNDRDDYWFDDVTVQEFSSPQTKRSHKKKAGKEFERPRYKYGLRQLRHSCGPFLTPFLTHFLTHFQAPRHPTRAVVCALRSAHAYRVPGIATVVLRLFYGCLWLFYGCSTVVLRLLCNCITCPAMTGSPNRHIKGS